MYIVCMATKRSQQVALQVAKLLKDSYALADKKKQLTGTRQAQGDKTEEFIEILDENGQSLHTFKKRAVVHRDGLWHRTVHAWIVTLDDEVLMQQRSAHKLTYPGKWDISCAGHIVAGASSRETAMQEAKEELGISLSAFELRKIGSLRQCFTFGSIIEKEIVDLYLVRRSIDLKKLVLQRSEVQQATLIPLQKVKQLVTQKSPAFVPHPEEYRRLFKILEE